LYFRPAFTIFADMKKLLLITAAVLAMTCVAQTVTAQSSLRRVQLGLRAGVFMQDLELQRGDFIRNDGSGIIDRYATEGRVGFNVALASRIRITALGRGALEMGLFFQPEIIYSQNNYKIQRTSEVDGDGPVSSIRLQSVDIPVLLSLKVSIVRARVGPVFNVFYRNSTLSNNIYFTPLKPVVGWTVGASVDIVGGLVLDGRYTGQFKDLKNHIQSGDTIYDSVRGSLTSWSIGLSYMF
jgi:hypothetical protein